MEGDLGGNNEGEPMIQKNKIEGVPLFLNAFFINEDIPQVSDLEKSFEEDQILFKSEFDLGNVEKSFEYEQKDDKTEDNGQVSEVEEAFFKYEVKKIDAFEERKVNSGNEFPKGNKTRGNAISILANLAEDNENENQNSEILKFGVNISKIFHETRKKIEEKAPPQEIPVEEIAEKEEEKEKENVETISHELEFLKSFKKCSYSKKAFSSAYIEKLKEMKIYVHQKDKEEKPVNPRQGQGRRSRKRTQKSSSKMQGNDAKIVWADPRKKGQNKMNNNSNKKSKWMVRMELPKKEGNFNLHSSQSLEEDNIVEIEEKKLTRGDIKEIKKMTGCKNVRYIREVYEENFFDKDATVELLQMQGNVNYGKDRNEQRDNQKNNQKRGRKKNRRGRGKSSEKKNEKVKEDKKKGRQRVQSNPAGVSNVNQWMNRPSILKNKSQKNVEGVADKIKKSAKEERKEKFDKSADGSYEDVIYDVGSFELEFLAGLDDEPKVEKKVKRKEVEEVLSLRDLEKQMMQFIEEKDYDEFGVLM